MKRINFSFPVIVILLSVLLGFFMNSRNGLSWEENLENMTSNEKVFTYFGLFVLLLLWKNWKNFKKG